MSLNYYISRELVNTSRGATSVNEARGYTVLIVEQSDAMIAINGLLYSIDNYSIVFLKPDMQYYFHYGTHCNYYSLLLTNDFFNNQNSSLETLVIEMFSERFFIIKPPNEKSCKLIALALEEAYYKQMSSIQPSVYPALYSQAAILYLLTRLHDFQIQFDRKLISPEYIPIAEQIAKFLDGNYKSNISLRNIESEFHLTRHYLCREFKKHFGIGIMQYLNIIRVRSARSLLERSNETISNITDMCGFSSYQNFYRLFITKFGVSPLKYLKKIRGYGSKEETIKDFN